MFLRTLCRLVGLISGILCIAFTFTQVWQLSTFSTTDWANFSKSIVANVMQKCCFGSCSYIPHEVSLRIMAWIKKACQIHVMVILQDHCYGERLGYRDIFIHMERSFTICFGSFDCHTAFSEYWRTLDFSSFSLQSVFEELIFFYD